MGGGRQDVTGSTYLYRCWDVYGHLIYVGITDDVERRKREHAKDKHWWPDVAKVTVMAFPRRIEALWAEWAVITTCSPTYNKSATLPATPDEKFIERFELVWIDQTESLWSVARRWWRIRKAPPADLIVKPEPRPAISNKVRGSHIYDPKPPTPAPTPNPAPIVLASSYMSPPAQAAGTQKLADPPAIVEEAPEPPSDFDLIVAEFGQPMPARQHYYEILREVGEEGIGGTEMTERLRAAGHPTVRQTVQDWLVEDFGYRRVLKLPKGRYRWNPDQGEQS